MQAMFNFAYPKLADRNGYKESNTFFLILMVERVSGTN